jgi:hypothetical protein
MGRGARVFFNNKIEKSVICAFFGYFFKVTTPPFVFFIVQKVEICPRNNIQNEFIRSSRLFLILMIMFLMVFADFL